MELEQLQFHESQTTVTPRLRSCRRLNSAEVSGDTEDDRSLSAADPAGSPTAVTAAAEHWHTTRSGSVHLFLPSTFQHWHIFHIDKIQQ